MNAQWLALSVSWGTAKLIRMAGYKATRTADRAELVSELEDAFDEDQAKRIAEHAGCDLGVITAAGVSLWPGEEVDTLFDCLEAAFSERRIDLDYDLDSVPSPEDDEDEDSDEQD